MGNKGDTSTRKQKYTFDPSPFGVHQKIIQSVPNGSAILEIGFASGYIAEKLKKNGNTIVGVEINKQDALRAKNIYEKIVIGNIEDINILKKIGTRKFDVIIFADVLEHLQDPNFVLKNIKKLLSPKGNIIISVPNIAFLTNRFLHLLGNFDYQDWGIMDRTHLRFFTYKTLLQLVQSSGLHISQFDYIGNFTQLPLYMQTIHPLFRQRLWWKKIEHAITGLWPQGLAVQFFLILNLNEN